MTSIPVVPVELTNDVLKQKSSIIREMAQNSQNYLTDVEKFVADVMAHEQEMDTDLLPDIALPHAKSDGVRTPFIAVSKYSDGIIWNNNNKVKLIVMIGAQEHADKEHLAIIAKLATNLANDDFIAELLNSDIQTIAHKVRGIYE
ncbi:PTS sugar transporter subunit IIA [Gilliamella apicola]|uniref:PTS sugar transporter subunit IIA n=1 Tax=Gilliamella apicola TaxID=1196095 RepID=UPI003986B5F2